MIAWLEVGLVWLGGFGAALWLWLRWLRKHEAARIAHAVAAGDTAELALLLVEKVDLKSVPEYFGEPALILAVNTALTGCPDTPSTADAISVLLSHGADIDERGTEWRTALMHAAAAGRRDLCAMLLARGADAGAREMLGRTAADLAVQHGHVALASFVRSAERE
jgi:hypothetical protein